VGGLQKGKWPIETWVLGKGYEKGGAEGRVKESGELVQIRKGKGKGGIRLEFGDAVEPTGILRLRKRSRQLSVKKGERSSGY